MSSEAPSAAQGDATAEQTQPPIAAAAVGDQSTAAMESQAGDAPAEAAGGGDAPAESGSDPADHRFECRSCGFVYDPGEGIRKLGIEPGTPFLELNPISFRCPVCRSRVGAFRDIGPRTKPSGFEENLDFGLGVNRLTPGQKNVLIFGGFALAIAFFLSLYSLR